MIESLTGAGAYSWVTKLPVAPLHKHLWLMHIWPFWTCISLSASPHAESITHPLSVSRRWLQTGRRTWARLRSRLAPPRALIFKRLLPLSSSSPALNVASANELYARLKVVKVRLWVWCGMVIAHRAVQSLLPFFLPLLASYCENNTAVPLINWLSAAHQFTLCSLIRFFFFFNGRLK